MLALDFILKNRDFVLNCMRKRGFSLNIEELDELDAKKRKFAIQSQELQEKRNKLAKEIGAKKARGEDASELFAEGEKIKEALPKIEAEFEQIEGEILQKLLGIPNILEDDVPEGADEIANLEVKKQGNPREFTFQPKEHFDLLPRQMDFETAAAISGSRFVILRGQLAKLERALINFMLEHNGARGYAETSVPALVRPKAFFGTSQLPKFEGDFFQTTDGYYLIPTAEVSLTNMYGEKIVPEHELPIRLTAATQCFRSEAGSAGKDTRGMIRQHQFTKVELVALASPETSAAEHEYMLETAEQILQKLGLPYRVVLLCGGDISFSAKKTYDIEVWLPGQGRYREISSVSNTGSFQALRMKARYKRAKDSKNEALHTLNGSALALGRTIVAILENYQQEDGSVIIPEILREYAGFSVIKP